MKKYKSNNRPLRSSLLAASLAASTMLASGPVSADPVTVVSWGGSYGAAQDAALFTDASRNSGIEIIRESGASMSKTCLQVESGSVTWDLVVTGSGGSASAAAKGCLEKIDYSVVDVSNNVDGALEPALMADGVPADKVYEVLSSKGGIDRAINKLRELKPHIAVFWGSGAQQAQLMKDAEVDMATGWNGRFDNAKKDGAKVGYTFNQALLDYDCFAMPKGAPNKDMAMKFLNEISKPEYQANLPFHITYGPTNKKAYDLTTAPKELIESLPSHPKNVPLMLPISLAWYAEHRTEALEKYMEFMSE